MSKFLDGCGVEYVHWIPSPVRKFMKVQNFDTPVLAAEACRSARIRKALWRNSIDSWEKLVAVKSEEFQAWRNYGEHSHALLVAIASANGYLIQPLR